MLAKAGSILFLMQLLLQAVLMYRPRFGMQKPAHRHCLRAGSFYPGLLAEEGNDTVKEIADGGDDVLDLAGEGRDPTFFSTFLTQFR